MGRFEGSSNLAVFVNSTVCLSVSFCLCVCFSYSVSLSLSLCLSLSLSVSLSLSLSLSLTHTHTHTHARHTHSLTVLHFCFSFRNGKAKQQPDRLLILFCGTLCLSHLVKDRKLSVNTNFGSSVCRVWVQFRFNGHRLVALPLPVNEILKWLSSLFKGWGL